MASCDKDKSHLCSITYQYMHYQSIRTGAVSDVITFLHHLTNSCHSNRALQLMYSCTVMHNVLKSGIQTEVVDFGTVLF